MKQDDMIRVPAFELPKSSSLTAHVRRVQREPNRAQKHGENTTQSTPPAPVTPPYDEANPEAVLAFRSWMDEHFYPRAIEKLRRQYDVRIEPKLIAGVYTEVITPGAGVPEKNKKRVLLNLHAGGFTFGARLCGQIESIPLASLGQFEVISVDYRLAPEHRHPAAADDVLAVYKKTLETHEPQDIGIFGYSAGGVLAAQSIARLQKEGSPLPSAVGMLFGAAAYWGEGDSAHWGAAIAARSLTPWEQHLYFKGADSDDPLVFPLRSSEVMARFPPALLVSATRDFALSSVVHTHSCLVKQGVEAELHIWEGLGHAFSNDPRLPQSGELHDATVRFFDMHMKASSDP